jgi:alcohol dehydrogenase
MPTKLGRREFMEALLYLGPGKYALVDRPEPVVELPTDAVVRMTYTTICGTDLHILKGDVPTVTTGRILGHEGVGIVEQVGAAVTTFKPGDRVLVSCISSCGKCEYCRRGMYSHCVQGGWVLGNTIDGTQANRVRIALADTSLYHLPVSLDEQPFVMLSDIFPTGYECGVLNGRVSPGSVVAIVGAGPIGLATLLTAQLCSPAETILIDLDENRLRVARELGATRTVDPSDGKGVDNIRKLTDGRGVDAAVEAVGIPETFELCQSLIAPGGVIANIGVHGRSATLHLESLWSQNISITTRLVDTVTTPMLLKTVIAGRLRPLALVTHRFGLSEIMQAYDIFAQAAASRALKVLIDCAH